MLKKLSSEERTMIFYESPFRLLKTLQQFQEYFGNRRASVSRELTKMFEETINGPLDVIIEHFKKKEAKGEIVIVVQGRDDDRSDQEDQEDDKGNE